MTGRAWVLASLAGACGGGLTAPDAGVDATPPTPPVALARWLTGNDDDVERVTSTGLMLAGGGADVDAAHHWLHARGGGGDVVVLRASGDDGYNEYLFADVGGVDSVETLRVDSRWLADDPYVAWQLARAEIIFVAGGDQWDYVSLWRGTAVEAALRGAWARGAAVGGTSAGLAVLGARAFTAEFGTVTSAEALADPFDPAVAIEAGLLEAPPLVRVVTDSHFAARDRMGRLLAFLCRAGAAGLSAPIGLGVDEGTAMVVDEVGQGEVLGQGAAYAVVPSGPARVCEPGAALAWSDVAVRRLGPGSRLALPDGASDVAATLVTAEGGGVVPVDPY